MRPLNKLFSSVRIGSMELKNRIVMAPMTIPLANEDGTFTPRLIDYYEARAKGGVGLIILPSISVDQVSLYARIPVLWDDKYIPSFREVVQAVHAHGAKVVPELCHAGPAHVLTSLLPGSRLPVSAVSLKDIEQIIQQFADASRRAREAGCDGVEIHAAHAYMVLGSFISALRNRRTDAYGGSIEGRIKLLLEVVKSIHDREGRDFPVIVRISSEELAPGGRDIRETQYIAPILAEAGVDAFDLSIGITGGDPRHTPPTGSPRAVNVGCSKAVKEVVNVPVMVGHRINDARLAEDVLDRNEADLVVMGRALLADPELPNKSAEGRFEDIAPCVGDRLCMAGTMVGKVNCLVNPALGKEKEMVITPAVKPKRVMVVGGGPGGLEAATIAALRGHDVTLYEKEAVLGGQFNLATAAPTKQELSRVIQYLLTQSQKAGVKVQLNTMVTPELIEKARPNVVIVATGSEPLIPDIPGIKGKRIVIANDVLADKVTVNPGNVLVIGGGMVGCEVADFLADLGDNRPGTRLAVAIVEMLKDVACDMEPASRTWLMQRLRAKEVRILTSAKVKEFLEDGVVIIRNGQEEIIRGMGTIILAMGAKPVDGLSGKIKDKVAEVYVIGDAKEPRKALEAIAEGAEIGRRI